MDTEEELPKDVGSVQSLEEEYDVLLLSQKEVSKGTTKVPRKEVVDNFDCWIRSDYATLKLLTYEDLEARVHDELF